MGSKDSHHVERFHELVALLKKIEVWWVVNMEIPVNPDFDGKEIDRRRYRSWSRPHAPDDARSTLGERRAFEALSGE
jgi:hypothetical protein